MKTKFLFWFLGWSLASCGTNPDVAPSSVFSVEEGHFVKAVATQAPSATATQPTTPTGEWKGDSDPGYTDVGNGGNVVLCVTQEQPTYQQGSYEGNMDYGCNSPYAPSTVVSAQPSSVTDSAPATAVKSASSYSLSETPVASTKSASSATAYETSFKKVTPAQKPSWEYNVRGPSSSYELLDFYEGRLLRNFTVSMGSGTTVEAKIEWVLKRLAKFDAARAETLQKWANEFEYEATFISEVELPRVNDIGKLLLQKGCAIYQTVIQQEPAHPGDKRYIVSRDVWDKLDATQRAGMILHEVFYREAISHGHKDSARVRYYVSLIASSEFNSMTSAKYVEVLKSIGFPSEEAGNGFEFEIGSVTRNLDGEITSGKLVREAKVKVADTSLSLPAGTLIDFRDKGYIAKVTTFDVTSMQLQKCKQQFPKGAFAFDEVGTITSFELAKPEEMTVCLFKPTKLAGVSKLEFAALPELKISAVTDNCYNYYHSNAARISDKGERLLLLAAGRKEIYTSGFVKAASLEFSASVELHIEGESLSVFREKDTPLEFTPEGEVVFKVTDIGDFSVVEESIESYTGRYTAYISKKTKIELEGTKFILPAFSKIDVNTDGVLLGFQRKKFKCVDSEPCSLLTTIKLANGCELQLGGGIFQVTEGDRISYFNPEAQSEFPSMCFKLPGESETRTVVTNASYISFDPGMLVSSFKLSARSNLFIMGLQNGSDIGQPIAAPFSPGHYVYMHESGFVSSGVSAVAGAQALSKSGVITPLKANLTYSFDRDGFLK